MTILIPCHIAPCKIVRPLTAIFRIFLYTMLYSNASAANTKTLAELDDAFHTTSRAYYAEFIRDNSNIKKKAKNLNVLARRVTTLLEKLHIDAATATIIANLEAIKTRIDHQSVAKYVALLLQQNELNSATEILAYAERNANSYTLARLHFLFAKHYFSRQDWITTRRFLTSTDLDNTLPEDDAHHAYIMQGVILQYEKKHRNALAFYKKVPKKSSYYLHAQLNIALVNLRQGWWTDAHVIIQNLVNDSNNQQHNAMVDRLYVILGYSMLKNGFYRDAREAFRNVSLAGSHSDKAILGLALSAANQEDYVGALNALSVLNQQKMQNIYTEESYLLLPFMYQQLQQQHTASSRYTQAIEHYQLTIDLLSKLKNRTIPPSDINQEGQITISGHYFDLTENYPSYFFRNRQLIESFEKNTTNTALRRQLKTLKQDYQQALDLMLHTVIDERITYLNSYMNQCRYGLAKLYDK